MKITPEKLFDVVFNAFKEIPFTDLLGLMTANGLDSVAPSIKTAFEAAADELNKE